MNHTPTPWTRGLSRCTVVSINRVIAKCHYDEAGEADAKRIVECVNAFEGIEDPKAYMETVNEIMRKGGEAANKLDQLKEEIILWRQERDALKKQKDQLINLARGLVHHTPRSSRAEYAQLIEKIANA